ncbi:MAG: phosphohistidine phosphatase SixA [Deltaproteobacteria bacterium]|nr:phosphohistidine phosphatase SixA [Deltaproteobacteria bacterium]
MKLYVMRHGIAEDAASSFHDFDRALTMKGRKRTREVARALQHAGEKPHFIVASPLVRALQTAEIVASVIEPEEPVTVRQEIAPGGELMTLVQEIVGAYTHPVMIVGHEPDLSVLVDQLLGGNAWERPFQKAMVVGLRLDASGKSRIRFVLDPKNLELKHIEGA